MKDCKYKVGEVLFHGGEVCRVAGFDSSCDHYILQLIVPKPKHFKNTVCPKKWIEKETISLGYPNEEMVQLLYGR